AKMGSLVDWMYQFWHFSAPATMFATQMFSSSRAKGVFKQIGSSERKLVLNGVRNTAWDLVYITEWFERIKRQATQNEDLVICSRDALLVHTAELVRQNIFGTENPAFLVTAGFSERVQYKYDRHMLELDSTKRALVPWPKNFISYRKRLIAEMEI